MCIVNDTSAYESIGETSARTSTTHPAANATGRRTGKGRPSRRDRTQPAT